MEEPHDLRSTLSTFQLSLDCEDALKMLTHFIVPSKPRVPLATVFCTFELTAAPSIGAPPRASPAAFFSGDDGRECV